MGLLCRFERAQYGGFALVLLGCSVVSKPDYEECKTNGDCRDAFGFGVDVRG